MKLLPLLLLLCFATALEPSPPVRQVPSAKALEEARAALQAYRKKIQQTRQRKQDDDDDDDNDDEEEDDNDDDEEEDDDEALTADEHNALLTMLVLLITLSFSYLYNKN